MDRNTKNTENIRSLHKGDSRMRRNTTGGDLLQLHDVWKFYQEISKNCRYFY